MAYKKKKVINEMNRIERFDYDSSVLMPEPVLNLSHRYYINTKWIIKEFWKEEDIGDTTT